MPKRILGLSIAFFALVLAACSSGGTSVAPTPTPTLPTPSANPAYTAAAVTVTVQNSPLPNQPVVLSAPDSTGSRPGTPIATQNTGSNGQTTFTGLTGAANYCFSTTVTPAPSPAPTPLTASQSKCTTFWAAGVTLAL